MTELQRTEPLSLSKFLHLPVSVNGAFLINYFSSLLRLSLIVFVPVMLGFAPGAGRRQGNRRCCRSCRSLAAFLLMVTALTYQFQGWLASLMSNPRRRRTVIVVTTVIFVLIVQLPNLLNFLAPWGAQTAGRPIRRHWSQELAKLNRDCKSGKFDAERATAPAAGDHGEATGLPSSRLTAKSAADGADGPAREHGLAGRLAAAGRHGRGGGKRPAVDSGAAGHDA